MIVEEITLGCIHYTLFKNDKIFRIRGRKQYFDKKKGLMVNSDTYYSLKEFRDHRREMINNGQDFASPVTLTLYGWSEWLEKF